MTLVAAVGSWIAKCQQREQDVRRGDRRTDPWSARDTSPAFGGDSDVEQFIREFEDVTTIAEWPAPVCILQLRAVWQAGSEVLLLGLMKPTSCELSGLVSAWQLRKPQSDCR